MLAMYLGELGSTGAREMSRFSGLLAGRTGHPPSRGGGRDGARAARAERGGAGAESGAKPEARAGASARPSTIERLGLPPQTPRERRAAARRPGRPVASP